MKRRNKAPQILMSESAWAFIRATAARAHPLETGGILIGVKVDSTVWITRAIEIEPRTARHASYVLPADATRRHVLEAREIDERVGYVGDWHSHPMNAPASQTDRRTLRRTARLGGSRSHLIVARKEGEGYAAQVLRSGGIHIDSCELALVGDLPSLGTEEGHRSDT